MLKSITIKNFRCFEHFNIENLARVNLIGGVNNIGKTAFLEAVFLLSGLNSIELPLQLNFLRGIKQNSIDVEDICEWLFYEKKSNRVISISTIDENNQNSELKLKLDKAEDTRLFPINPKSNKKRILKDLKLEYYQGQQVFSLRVFLTIDEKLDEVKLAIKTEEGELEILPPSEFLSSRWEILPTEDTEKFSDLEANNRQHEVIEILQILEPRLKRLAVLVTRGMPMIYGDIGLNSLIPIPLMGEGMVRLLSIVLAILNNQNGTILIDEIENGFHHSITTKIWQAIAKAARITDNQIFATTHSLECIKAAHQAFSQNENYDFAYHRFQRTNNIIKSVTYDKETIETSVEMDFEMR